MTEQVEQRVRALEVWRQEVTTGRAVDDEKRKHMDDRFDRLESRLDRQDSNMSRLLWLVLAAIIAVGVQFVTSGALNVN